MGLVTRPIPNLFNGISQQPASLRSPTQAELQENFYSAISTGTRKRPPTRHRAKLSNTPDNAALIHFISRDASEKYEVRFRNGAIEVWDLLTGTAKTVTYPNGTSYLTTATPRLDLAVITVEDYTFVVNRTVTVKMNPAINGVAKSVVAVSSITYTGTLASVTSTVTTGSAHGLAVGDWVTLTDATLSQYTTGTFRVATVPSGTTFTFLVTHEVVTASPVSGSGTAPFTYAAVGVAFTGTKQTFGDLPAATGSGNVWKIEGEPGSDFDNYYVKDVGTNLYQEIAGYGVTTKFDASTMPYVLIRAEDGGFKFKQATWDDRIAGDDVSNPIPSFVGEKISNVTFARDRLTFLAGENIIMSKSHRPFAFWGESASVITDDDPIDKAASIDGKVSILKNVANFNGALLVMSETAQFQLSGGADGTLTPKNAKLTPTTAFDADPYCRPVGAGSTMFFAQPKGTSVALREYYVQDDTVTNDAADVTAHCPNYVLGSATQMAASTTEDFLVVLADGQPNAMFTYKYYWTEDSKKLQSAWSKFVFSTGDYIKGVTFIGTLLYVAVDRSDGHYLDTMDLQADLTDGTLPFEVMLDRKVSLTGVYDAGNDWTTWTLPYADSNTLQLVLGDAWGEDSASTRTITRPTSSTVRTVGDYSAHPAWIGRKYTARYRFSRFYVKDDQNQAITTAVIKLMTMVVTFAKTGFFRVEVQPRGRSTPYRYTYSGIVLGTASATLNSAMLTEGEFRFPVMSGTDRVTIDIVNDSYLPCALLSAEWEGDLTQRAKRI